MPPISRYYDVQRDDDGNPYLEVNVSGILLQRIPLLNKGTGFTVEERALLELEGLLPPRVTPLDLQKQRSYAQFLRQPTPLDKHIYLRLLQDRNEVLFYALVSEHLEEMLPIIYTPTVGEAVQLFSHIYRLPRGFAVTAENVEQVETAISNVPLEDVRLAVATDSSAILGIGDQGFGGMAISIGKLSIYTVAGGIGPDKTLPIQLDVGTDREELRDDLLYVGAQHPRLKGDAYFDLVDRFVEAFADRYPGAILQWEDFSKDVAFGVLDRYRKRLPSFNDDIQGTGATALAGVLSACELTGISPTEHRYVIYGAGAGGIGVAWAILEGLMGLGLSREEARERVLILDSRGLLMEGREMEEFKKPYAQTAAATKKLGFGDGVPQLLEVIEKAEATALIGLSGQPDSFDNSIVDALCRNTPQPLIFPLSNPSSATEATPSDLISWSDGMAIIATGSPFEPVEFGGTVIEVGQGNNAFVFPGLGFGAVLAKVSEVTDAMVLAAAYALAEYTKTTPGRVYPRVREMGQASAYIAAAVIEQAQKDGVAREPRVEGMSRSQIEDYVRAKQWVPGYLPFRKA